MSPAEIVAMRDLEAAEQAVSDALMKLETARQRLADIMSRERQREQAKERPSLHLRLVVGARR